MKCLSFDIWNTLLDLEKLYSLLSEEISESYSRDANEVRDLLLSAYRKALALRLEGAFRSPILDSAAVFSKELGMSEEELFRAFVRILRKREIEDLAFEDAKIAVRELKGLGYRMGLLGNVMFWPGMVTRYILERNDLLEYFDASLFSDEAGVQKPDKRAFEAIAERLNCKVEDLVHIGDSLENDLAGALLSGVSAVLIRREVERAIHIGKKAVIVRALTELPQILSKLQ
ncbi:MAG: HAD family hydrolase [Fervidicoccaceae archaeon]